MKDKTTCSNLFIGTSGWSYKHWAGIFYPENIKPAKYLEYLPIKVECHSGWKADEYPTSFYLKNEKIEIEEITDQWYQGDLNPNFPVADYFKVQTTSGTEYILRHEIKKDQWFLVIPNQ